VKIWLRQHRMAVAAAIRKFGAQRSAAALNALVIGIALSLPAGGYALLSSLRLAVAGASIEPQISVFLRHDTRRRDVDGLLARLKSDSRLREVRFVPREQALKELQATEGLAEVVSALDSNPLPDAFVLLPIKSAAGTDPAALELLAVELRALPQVAHVQADLAWARRLGALANIGRMATALLAALLAFGLVAITFNTIRLQILTQRSEIEISKLIGATDTFIRRPFFYLGALQGMAGGAVSLAILWGGLAALNVGITDLAASYGSSFRLSFLGAGDALAIVLFSASLGWFGAYISVSKYLREIEQEK
jgi:cell division transport system permease protein